MKLSWLWGLIAGVVVVTLLFLQVFATYHTPLPEIRESERVTVYSLQSDMEGADYSTGQMYHGLKVTGKVELSSSAEKSQLLEVFYKALEDGPGEDSYSCFIVHHAIRFIKAGKVIDVLISFDSEKCAFMVDGKMQEASISKSGKVYFDRILKRTENRLD